MSLQFIEGFSLAKVVESQAKRILELEAERDALNADAERYRFLEYQCSVGEYKGIISRKAIDKAIKESK